MISDDVPGNTELEGGIPGILHLQRPKRINIYLDVDGVLLANDKQPALFADEFIEFLLRHHDVYWLTTHCRNLNDDPVRNVLEPHFKRETVDLLHQIKPTQWDTYKTEAIDFSRPFLWYDDQLFDEEKVQLKEHGVLDSWVEVDLATRPNSLLEFIIQPSS